MEGDAERLELGHALVKRLGEVEAETLCGRREALEIRQGALVGVPEIERVRQARAHDLSVAARDLGAMVGRLDVGDHQEVVRQAVLPAAARDEALLVGADGQLDHLGGNLEERLLERADQHDGPFDEARHLLQQPLVRDHLQPLREGEIVGVGADDLLPALGVEHDIGLLELADIVLEAPHLELGRRMEAMPDRPVAERMPATSKSITAVSPFSGRRRRGSTGAGGPSAGSPARARRPPSAWTSARGSRG